MQIRPQTAHEKEILGIWCSVSPSKAFFAGLNDYAGRVLVPTHKNLDDLRKRITESSRRSTSESQRKLLACLDTYLSMLEPVHVPDDVLEAFFGHMIKEGTNANHLMSLAEYGRHALSAYLENKERGDWPTGQKLLAVIRCNGLLELLRVVRSQTSRKMLKRKIDSLVAEVQRYKKHVHVDGFSTGEFEEVWKIIQRQGCDLGRENVYHRGLRDLYDYGESPSEIEEKGLHFLRNELGDYVDLVGQLATRLKCDERPQTLVGVLKRNRALETSKIISYLNRVRVLTRKMVHRKIVNIDQDYFTKVIETPRYLSGVTPSGATFFLDYLTRDPRQIFLATTDPRRDPHTVPAQLLNLLMHEEYGHCVHVSNSARNYAARPEFAERLWSTLGIAVSEGISFHRELEFGECLDRVGAHDRLTNEERDFVKFFDGLGGFENLRMEYHFFTETWRIVRFLRVIGDARINSGRQSLADFVEWANRETGLPRSMIYFQVFPAHQSSMGGATTYAIVGEEVKENQKVAQEAGKDIVKFNTYASSLGFVPRSVFRSRLLQYAKT